MSFGKRSPDSRPLIRIATMCMIVGMMWPYLFRPATQLGKNLSHAWCGLLLGFSIAVNLGALWVRGRQSGCGGKDAAGQ
jgi:hypothetical protein